MARHDPEHNLRIERITSRVLESAKYRSVQLGVVHRMATEAVRTTKKDGEAVKAVKRRLHQAYGAFLSGKPAAAVDRVHTVSEADPSLLRGACLEAMRSHASTAERLPHIEQYAEMLAAWCGVPATVLDIGCGLSPLATPWLVTEPGAEYWCCDIDSDLMVALNRLAPLLPVDLHARTCDLVVETAPTQAQLCLALKLVSTLEAQQAGAAAGALRAIRAENLVVSVPAKSLGGGRSYADPLAQVERAIEGSQYEIYQHRLLGPELYVHLLPNDTHHTSKETDYE